MKISPNLRQNWKTTIFLVVTAAVLLACGSSPDPTATLSIPPVDPITQEPVVMPSATREPFVFEETETVEETVEEPIDEDYPAFYVEEWDSDTDAWFTSFEKNADSGDLDEGEIYTENGKLVFELGRWLIGYVFYDPFTYEDVRLDVKVENRGANTNNVLLVCRSSDEGQYLVSVSNGGLYSIYAYEGASDTYYRMANGGSNLIKQGKEINTYTLICEGRDLILGINGTEVKKWTDNRYVFRDGMVGIGVASEDVQPIKLEIDYIEISVP